MLRKDISFKQALIRKEEGHLKSTRTSKWIRWAFFIFIGYTCVSTTLAWTSNFGLLKVNKAVEVKKDESKDQFEEISAHTFAKTFAKEYLFWNAGNEETRKERLKPFLAPGLDEQAGFNFKDIEWNSWARMIDVWSVTEREEGRLDVLIYAETQMSKVENPEEKKRVDRWLVVPIKKAGPSYVVIGTPYYVPPPEPEIKEEEEKKEERRERVDMDTRDSITSFMESFWKVYTTGTPDEIQYFIKGDKQKGLTGILSYRELVKIDAFKEGKTYRVECDIRFLDLSSGGEVVYPYVLQVKQEGDRWYVTNIQVKKGDV